MVGSVVVPGPLRSTPGRIVDQMRKRVIELKGGEVVRDQDRGVYGSDR